MSFQVGDILRLHEEAVGPTYRIPTGTLWKVTEVINIYFIAVVGIKAPYLNREFRRCKKSRFDYASALEYLALEAEQCSSKS